MGRGASAAGTATASVASAGPVTDRLARVALPVACAVSWLVIAAFQREPSVAAEASYLGVLTGAVLLAALQAAPRVGTLLGAAVVLLGAIPWALPGTADRSAATGILLGTVLAIAAAMPSHGSSASATSSTSPAWPPQRIAALVVGAQILARGGLLLSTTTMDVLALAATAALAAVALVVIAAHRGVHAAALAGAVAFALGPGFDATTALALAAPAAAIFAADGRRAPWMRIVAAATLGTTLLWDVERGAFLVLGAVALAAPRWARWTAGLAALLAFFGPGADRRAGVEGVAWLVVLLPIVIAELGPETGSWRFGAGRAATRFAAVCLGLAVAAQLPDLASLAIPAVILALSVVGARPVATALQSAWSGALAFTIATLAAYPWLRPRAVVDAAALFGLGGGWRAALAIVALLAAAGVASMLAGRRRARGALAPLAVATLLAALMLVTHPSVTAAPIARQPVEIDAASSSWSAPLTAPVLAGGLVVDSSLSNAASIAPGAVIAEVRLATPDGELTLPLRAGIDTGEWAARRPDVAAIAGFVAPDPWLHWVDAGRGFFGQRYRVRLPLERPVKVSGVELRRAAGVAPDIVLTVFGLELTR